jgi:hypothetical protein
LNRNPFHAASGLVSQCFTFPSSCFDFIDTLLVEFRENLGVPDPFNPYYTVSIPLEKSNAFSSVSIKRAKAQLRGFRLGP